MLKKITFSLEVLILKLTCENFIRSRWNKPPKTKVTESESIGCDLYFVDENSSSWLIRLNKNFNFHHFISSLIAFAITRSTFKLSCCLCHLVHSISFKIIIFKWVLTYFYLNIHFKWKFKILYSRVIHSNDIISK